MSFKIFKQLAAENIVLNEMRFISELNMEAFLIENAQLLTTDEYSSSVNIILNQLVLKNGRKTKKTDGRIDLLANIDNEYIAVIELKNAIIVNEHVAQLCDYLDEFYKRKSELLSDLSKEHIFQGDKLMGIIVGTDFHPMVKAELISGKYINDIQIIGLSIKRYTTIDKKEIYIMSELFAPDKSEFIKLRFNSWDEFAYYQHSEMLISKNTLELAKRLHDESIKKFDLTFDQINYAKIAFTLNIPNAKKKSVFAFCKLYRTKIRIFMDFDDKIPKKGTANPDKRFPTSYYIDINDINQLDNDFWKNINTSYIQVSKYQNLTTAST
jgi:hypothetical protein